MSFLTGGSKSKQQSTSTSVQESGNHSYDQLQQDYHPQIQTGVGANSLLASLLGIGDQTQGRAGLDAYEGSAGYNNDIRSGNNAINVNQASKGLLGSGSTLKSLTRFGQDLGHKYYSDYIDRLLGLSNNGLQAGQLVSGVGQYSTGQSNSQSTGSSSSTPGIAAMLGQIASSAAMASDRRLKTDIELIGNNDGLNVYTYRYLWDAPGIIRNGYMADEVREYNPNALGPKINDEFDTVYYDKLPPIKVA